MIVKINEIKANPNNPRLVKDDKFAKLVQSIKGFPDMLNVRPIVVNKDMIVLGGNMRLKAMKHAGYKEAKIEVVDWTEEQQREFIIKDNLGYGEWDWEIIANEWDAEQLTEWGMDIPEIEKIEQLEDGEEIIFEQSVQLEPPKEYILIMAEPNSNEWEELKQMLKLKMVRRGGYKEGSAFDAVSLERVLNWDELKIKLNVNSNTE